MLRLIAPFVLLMTPLAAGAKDAVLIRGARVFDGTGAPALVRDVLIRGERIARVAPSIAAPRRARVIDASGLTLLPGLHDLHIHTRSQAFETAEALREGYAPFLRHGVTSVNEYSVSGPMLAGIRAMDAPTPHLALAIRLGVPHGHGTESPFTNGITTQVTTPGQARAAMPAILRQRPDVIKIFADGWRYGDPERPDRPSMDLPTMTAIVRAAHARRVPVVTHTVTLEGAKIAAAAGVDALVHGIGDLPVDDALIGLMKRHGTAYVPTMAVYEPQQGRNLLPAEWAKLSPQDRAREDRRRAGPVKPYDARRWAVLRGNLRRLRAAGVAIGIGTDTGIGGVYQGSATIRELRLFVQEGFTPAEALAAATSVSARIMHARRHGRIAPGQRADLVLTGGRPDERIEDLYDVRKVVLSGRESGEP